MKASNGTGPEARLAEHLTSFDNPLDWSSDGMLLFTSFDSTSSTDLWLLPLDGDRQRMPLPHSGSRWGVQAQISPDGRWLAYASNESGRYDVYVRPFPSGEGKWLITPSGGVRAVLAPRREGIVLSRSGRVPDGSDRHNQADLRGGDTDSALRDENVDAGEHVFHEEPICGERRRPALPRQSADRHARFHRRRGRLAGRIEASPVTCLQRLTSASW